MTIKEIDDAIEEGQSLKQIAEAYSDIANLKVKRIRVAVERNRLFFEEISQVFSLVKKLAIKKKVNILKPKKIVSIILTSNYRFYGNINSKLIDFFLNSTSKFQTDKIILGKAAIDYFRTKGENINTGVVLKTDQPNEVELINLVNMVKDYNQVLVFYSSLKSLLVQEPKVADITATSSIASNVNKNSSDFQFIFEPELPKILNFFETQIITLLLEETFLESELARTASRFISMDRSETEANKFINEYERLKKQAKRNLDNNTILENFASLAALKKGAYISR